MQGIGADSYLAEARQLAVELAVTSESDLGKCVAKLARAQGALDAGQPLIAGHCPEDLTSGQLRFIRENRPEVIPSEVMARLDADGALRVGRGLVPRPTRRLDLEPEAG